MNLAQSSAATPKSGNEDLPTIEFVIRKISRTIEITFIKTLWRVGS
jgi:hypothetical protein